MITKHTNKLRQIIALAFILIGIAGSSQAQNQSVAPSPAENRADSGPNVTSAFDAAKNETTVEFRQMTVAESPNGKLYLSVSATYPTKELKRSPEDVIFIISALSPGGYRYPQAMPLVIRVDGKELSPVLMLNLDKRQADEEYLETIGTRMKFDVYRRLSRAKAVEMRLHEAAFSLSEQQIAKLRELAEMLHK